MKMTCPSLAAARINNSRHNITTSSGLMVSHGPATMVTLADRGVGGGRVGINWLKVSLYDTWDS